MSNTIAENLLRLQTVKQNIADAIIEKGGTISANAGLEEFAAAILSIPSKDIPDAGDSMAGQSVPYLMGAGGGHGGISTIIKE